MINLCSCINCKKEYSNKGIFTHFDRSHGTDDVKSKYATGYNGKYDILAERVAIRKENEKSEYDLNPRRCLQCNTKIEFESDPENTFCNRSCSATYTNKKRIDDGWKMSEETKHLISNKVSGKSYKKLVDICCCVCDKSFQMMCGPRLNLSKIRCDICRHITKHRKTVALDLSKLKDYRLACKFRFGLNKYPAEFDFTLIESYGWYKASNHGNNLFGVSRDHMVSVRYGFDNNIDPTIIAHPANCKLMRHNLNVKKYINNSITYEELLIKIKEWDIKYLP